MSRRIYRLSAVTSRIRQLLLEASRKQFWVQAQFVPDKKPGAGGHCYGTLVEIQDGREVAKLRAVIWRSDLEVIEKTLQARGIANALRERVEICACCAVRYHDVYGLSLQGCREWHRAQRALPPTGILTRLAMRRPRLLSILLPMLPHFIGAMIDLTHNLLCLSAQPDGHRWLPAFRWLALAYTVATLAATGLAAWLMTAPLWRAWHALRRGEAADGRRLAELRRHCVRIPFWSLVLSAAGWLPGALIVPFFLRAATDPVPASVAVHLGLSFLIAGLIALTYCVLAATFLTIRIGYPQLWDDAQGMQATAQRELAGVNRWLGALQVSSGLVPLSAAAGLILSSVMPGSVDALTQRSFQWMQLSLIALGMLGIVLTAGIQQYLRHTLGALTGERRRPGLLL